MNVLRNAHTTPHSKQRIAVYCIALHYTTLCLLPFHQSLNCPTVRYSAAQHSSVLYSTVLSNLPPYTNHLASQLRQLASKQEASRHLESLHCTVELQSLKINIMCNQSFSTSMPLLTVQLKYRRIIYFLSNSTNLSHSTHVRRHLQTETSSWGEASISFTIPREEFEERSTFPLSPTTYCELAPLFWNSCLKEYSIILEQGPLCRDYIEKVSKSCVTT